MASEKPKSMVLEKIVEKIFVSCRLVPMKREIEKRLMAVYDIQEGYEKSK